MKLNTRIHNTKLMNGIKNQSVIMQKHINNIGMIVNKVIDKTT